MRRFYLIVIFIMGFFVSFANAADVGRFIEVKNYVFMLKNGKPPFIKAKVGDTVSQSDIVSTGVNSTAVIKFFDGNKITISSNSRVILNEYLSKEKALIKLTKGKVTATVVPKVVRKIKQSKNYFKIETPIAVAGVRGTKFSVQHKDFTVVKVYKGLVEVYNLAYPQFRVFVAAGNMVFIRPRKTPSEPKKFGGKIGNYGSDQGSDSSIGKNTESLGDYETETFGNDEVGSNNHQNPPEYAVSPPITQKNHPRQTSSGGYSGSTIQEGGGYSGGSLTTGP
ncbi:FecR family protein [Hippea jasoniae]|uniref:FecR family protein n=1 Tax=Hippea jasoniae TaxID=944479 RepID=UPI00055398A1|nr:FecR family protein [Hippea jasoniae]